MTETWYVYSGWLHGYWYLRKPHDPGYFYVDGVRMANKASPGRLLYKINVRPKLPKPNRRDSLG